MDKIIDVKNAQGDLDTKATIIHQNNIDYTPKVSVIIPVYNTEKYLRECLDSVINQTLKEIEIICVDDGSTDSSLEILKEYANKDNRFTIITQQNLHAGVARNAGLAVAKGEYVSFLDSDDWFELKILEETTKILKETDSELCCCQYRNFNELKNKFEEIRGINCKFKNNEPQTFKKEDLIDNLYSISNPMPWNKVISRKFIEENCIRFQSLISSNDIYFSLLSMSLCNKFTLILEPLINYRYNRADSLKNTRDKHPTSYYFAYKALYNHLQRNNIFSSFKTCFFKALVSTSIWTLNHTREKRAFIKKIIKEQIIPEFSLLDKNKKYIPEYLYEKLKTLLNYDIIVSLTSFPARIDTVHETIESLLDQSLHADKIILWLAEEQFPNKEADLPQSLLNLKGRGLTIDWYKDIRSYKKLIPTLKKYPNSIIVTADDDNIYPKQWLQKLYDSYLKYPKDIQAHRITKFFYKHGFEVIAGGQDYYKKPSYLNKLVGLGGVLYPPNCFYKDILNEELFMKLAPTNDDQWFWFQAVLNGTKIRVVENPEIKANYAEGTQQYGLTNINDKGEKLFWKDFHRLLEYYPKLKNILLKEAKKMKNKNNGTIDKYKKDLEIWYKKVTKKDLDLENPQTFNEKIQWMKIYDSTPIKTRLADKYLVRDWVKEKIGEEYLIPLLGVYDSFDEIDFEKLPNQFVIKCNHGCAYNIIVQDKKIFDIEDARSKINKWMNENFAFKFGYELHYSSIPRKIIIEKYIENTKGNLQDYKFMCFNGKIELILVDSDRYNSHKRNIYDKNWNLQNFSDFPMIPEGIPKPLCLNELKNLVLKISKEFNFVRVDFYIVENKIYFGEVTFTPASGTLKFPSKIDLKLGRMIKLPKLAYNVDTGEYYKLPNYKLRRFLQSIFSLKNHSNKKHKILTVLGVKIKMKRKQKGEYSFIEKMFSIKNKESKNNKWYKVIAILGIKFKFKNKDLTLRKNLEYQRKAIESQKNTIEEQNKETKNIKNIIEGLNCKIDNIGENLAMKLTEIKKDFDKVYFAEQTETQIKQCIRMYNDINKDIYFEKYKKLINGLDNKSIDCVSDILARIERIANKKVQYNNILTKEEREIVQKIRHELYDKIVKISDECYAYKEIFLPRNVFEVNVFYYSYQLDMLADISRIKNADIIDVGAYVGDSAILFSKYTNNKVHVFEPTSQNYKFLCQTIEMNNLKNVVPVNKGLGSKDEILQCNLYGGASGLVDKRSDNYEDIEVTTLDRYVKEGNINVGLIKVDIEGFEQEFLKGAINTIEEQKPTLLISIYHNASDFFDIKPMIESWDLGYKFKITKPVDGTIKNETLLIAQQ